MSSPISTPNGGGAVSGLGEKFSPDLFTGTGNFSVPIALPPGRNGFQPELGLQYSTGSGNSPFGMGWNLSVPGVMRKTAKGIPRYDEAKDTFILSGAEDLVAVKKMNIRYLQNGTNDFRNNDAGIALLNAESGIITQYRPRTEGLFARIYHLQSNLRNCWKVLSKNGLTSWYGSKEDFASDRSLVSDPENPNKIFAWKLTRTEDTFGNHILYIYEHDAVNENDYHHWDQNYLKEIKYADYSLTPFGGTGTAYMVRVEFVYEERKDAFSDFKAGFEIRTTQRCKEINIYTNPQEGEIKTRTYNFQYSDEVLPEDERPYNGVALLCKVEVMGHDPDVVDSEPLPPLEFRYTHFKPKQQKFKKLEGNQLPLASLANPGFELIDLFGNGLPDIVEINGLVRYWRNLGDGKFDIPRVMKDAPLGFNLGDPDVQLIDANGDGRTDLMVNGTNMAGYFSTKYGASWDAKAFKKYKQAPSFNLADPEVKMMDLTGDGITDALRNGSSFECFFHDKNDGWTETRRVPKKQIAKFPNVSFADPRIKMADMTADGLQDIVHLHSGNVTYWPNLGYGNFAKPVVMKNSPRFQYPFDPARIQLADIDGDGLADLIYVDANKITFWINQSGNGWSEPFEICGTPFVTNINGIRVTDILGNGTAGVLYSFDAMMNTQQHRWFFLDLTGGVKPYLLHEMDNNMGALTRVSYLSSTRYYLADQYGMNPLDANSERKFNKRNPWKTTLPFPVQTVSRVEVIDQLSKGKLATEYIYHHGYWDGGEREFRGFGRVDQRDTETFERYVTPSVVPEHGVINQSFNSSFVSNSGEELQFNTVAEEHYSPPIETRNWFHLGPVGDEFGDWMEVDFREEYWQGIRDKGLADGTVLPPDIETFRLLQSLSRRAKRDAFRAWRGSSLRSELYALDEYDSETKTYKPGSGGIPYTVSESSYGLRLETFPGQQVNDDGDWFTEPVLIVPKETSGYVFFSFATASRTSQWERGIEPMTQLSFTTDYDEYGQPLKQLSVALSRGMVFTWDTDGTIIAPLSTNVLAEDGGGPMLSTASVTHYAQKDNKETYIVDRSCKAISYEIIQQTEDVFELRTRVFSAELPTEVGNTIYPIIGFSINYYADETAFGIGLNFGDVGKHGALARSETLVLTGDILDSIYTDNSLPIPVFFDDPDNDTFPTTTEVENAGYPHDFAFSLQNNDTRLGYKRRNHTNDPDYATGWYAESGRTKYDWQVSSDGKGLVLATKDAFESWAEIEYDDYNLLPKKAMQHLTIYGVAGATLDTEAKYDYRVMQAKMITDPNGNRAIFDFSPLGLLKQSGVIGKNTIGTGNSLEGDLISESIVSGERQIIYKPSVLMKYDFFAFCKPDNNPAKNPVWVKTIQQEKHYRKGDHTAETSFPEIIKAEYTDGFGRLLQTRTQAEDVIFGDPMFGDSGLPEIQGQNGDAIGVERTGNDLNVVVSGWKIYNNKGKVVEQYEPYFDRGFDYLPPFDLSALLLGIQSGEKIRMFYDPRGNVIRTINPDNSEQWVIHGNAAKDKDDNAQSLSAVDINNSWSFKNYKPTPWESYTYDTNDNGQRTHSSLGAISSHWNTPSNSMVDALGRTIKTISRLDNNVSDNEVVMKYTFDIPGNQTKIVDTYSRIVFKNIFSLAKQALQTEHIDGGVKRVLFDVAGKPVTATDDKGARVFNGYDAISRPQQVWAIDKTSVTPAGGAVIDTTDSITLRQYSVYGGPGDEADNLVGKLSQHYDEAGLTEISSYDFKGNPLGKVRRVIKDDEILNAFTTSPLHCYRVDWTGLDESILDTTLYESSIEYDALNRSTKITYPEDVHSNRKEVVPVYNKAGALQKITMDTIDYVKHIAYNAKGQKLLVAWGGDNNVMMRFAYDKKTFRLSRVRAEKYEVASGNDFQFNYLNGNVRYEQAYIYDLVGNVLSVNDQTPDCGITGDTEQLQKLFEYDALYRLIYANGREMTSQGAGFLFADAPQIGSPTAADCRYYEQDYQYDKLGNITRLRHRVNHDTSQYYTRMFNYISGVNKLEEVTNGDGSVTYSEFTYDDNGNTTGNNDDRNYEWDYGDKLRSFYVIDSGSITQFTHYLYDAAGNRVKKITRKNGGSFIESSVYIDGGFEHHKKNSEAKNYIQIQGGIEKRIGAFTDDMNHLDAEMDIYHITDYLSSATIRLDKDGGEIDREDYYPYGDTAVRSFDKKRYRFTGKEKDEESGLYYMGARYYASWCCKFLTIDPKAPKYAGQSPYAYANCNPMVFNDPSGLEGEQSKGNPEGGKNDPKTNNVENAEGKEQAKGESDKPKNESTKEENNKPESQNSSKSGEKKDSKTNTIGVGGSNGLQSSKTTSHVASNSGKANSKTGKQDDTKFVGTVGLKDSKKTTGEAFKDLPNSTGSSSVSYNDKGPETGMNKEAVEELHSGLHVFEFSAKVLEKIGGQEKLNQLFKEGKFLAYYNGKLNTWSFKFFGNQFVSPINVSVQKGIFNVSKNTINLLNSGENLLKQGGQGLVIVGEFLSVYEYEQGKIGKTELALDTFASLAASSAILAYVGMAAADTEPLGWIASAYFLILKPFVKLCIQANEYKNYNPRF